MEGCLLNWYYFFLKNLVEITIEVIWTWSLFCWKLLTANLVSLIDIEILGILVSFCVILRRLCISKHKVFRISLLLFNIYRIYRIVTSFIPDAANLSFFPLVTFTMFCSLITQYSCAFIFITLPLGVSFQTVDSYFFDSWN